MVIITQFQNNPTDLAEAKTLIEEYGNFLFSDLGLNAGRERFYKELDTFPKPYFVLPDGTFVLAKQDGRAIGCVGIRRFDGDSAEMKRLFVYPEFRGQGVAAMLCQQVLELCRRLGYKKILLDTNREMADAVSLYKRVGFYEIPAYTNNENPNPVFMSYSL